MYLRDAHPPEARQAALHCVLATLASPGQRQQEGTAVADHYSNSAAEEKGASGAQSLRDKLMVHSALHLLNQAAAGAQGHSQQAILTGIEGGAGYIPVLS